MLRRRSLVLALLALLTITGCTSPASQTATPARSDAPTASQAPSPTPTPEVLASAIVAYGEGFDIVASDGSTLHRHHWPDAAGPTVEALETAFGSPPVRTESAGDGTHVAPADVYTWGGLRFASSIGLTPEERQTYTFSTTLMYTEASVGDVALTSKSGIQVGMTVAEVEAVGVQRIGELAHYPEFGIFYYFDSADEAGLDSGTSNAVRAATGEARSEIVEMFAPLNPFL